MVQRKTIPKSRPSATATAKTKQRARGRGPHAEATAPRHLVPKAHWPDAQRLVSTRYLKWASGGWDQVPGDLRRRGEDASAAISIARILRATLRAMLQINGERGKYYRSFLSAQAEKARQLLEHDFDATWNSGEQLEWHDVDGTSLVPNGDVVFAKGTEFRTFYVDALLNTLERWRTDPQAFEDKSNPASAGNPNNGIQVMIVGMVEDFGIWRSEPGQDRLQLLTRVQKAMHSAREDSADAEKILRAALGKRGIGLRAGDIKGLLSYRDKREKRKAGR